ncbi:thrombospondin type 3 repeat-containing protein [Nocardioides sp. URHA0020]|uniref:thrombospondin type 3 repeat-containing protein n=1 Tax=Nocardioides sp. URHA0020 TaxID=1380392 RepID=UPI00048C7663|nr:thrombospondin type 3 repeat-containing protein [Nocardioides sp. URHA0020]
MLALGAGCVLMVDAPARSAPAPGTLVGYFPGAQQSGQSGSARSFYDVVAGQLGTPQVYRAFLTAPPSGSFTGSVADFGPAVVVSFKGDPVAVASGRYDSSLRAWFASIPSTRTVWWSYFHEPEDDIERGAFTPAQYRAAWRHLIDLAPQRANLHPTLILMQWSLTRASRPIDQYVVPGLATLAWDAYESKSHADAAALLSAAKASSSRFGLRFAVAETSVMMERSAGRDRAQVVATFARELLAYARAQDADFVTWFETDKSGLGTIEQDWRLSPYAAAAGVWRTAMAATPTASSSPSTAPLPPTKPHPRPKPRYADADHDGLSNRRERRLHTNPRRHDTDHDGLGDGREVRRLHTNPRKRDTDHDGVSDRREVRRGTDPRRAGR